MPLAFVGFCTVAFALLFWATRRSLTGASRHAPTTDSDGHSTAWWLSATDGADSAAPVDPTEHDSLSHDHHHYFSDDTYGHHHSGHKSASLNLESRNASECANPSAAPSPDN